MIGPAEAGHYDCQAGLTRFVFGRSFAWRVVAGRLRACLARLTIGRTDARSPRRPRPEHAVIQQQVDSRSRRQRRESLQQIQRLDDEVGCSVRPCVPQIQHHSALGREVQPFLRHRRAKRIAAETFELRSIPRWHHDRRVQVEPAPARVTRSESRWSGRSVSLPSPPAAPYEQPVKPPFNRGDQAIHLLVGRRRSRMKMQRPEPVLDIHAIEHKRMHVHVQVQRTPKALDDGDGPTAPAGHAPLPRAAAVSRAPPARRHR
jgi:hypothetical protein